MLNLLINASERGLIPNPLLRLGIRNLCTQRLRSLEYASTQDEESAERYLQMLKDSPVAVETEAANEQHYEVPANFYLKTLGPHLKYSCAYWPKECKSLAEAERLALKMTMERAQLQDGMAILELGCGWGSLTLAMAEAFPHSQITAISNSNSQREFILKRAQERNIHNVEVLTRNIANLEAAELGRGRYDRVVSVEMFEHLRNYEVLLQRICRWLKPKGKLFVHIFTHKKYAYLFAAENTDDWMGKYFFTGGQMPSQNLLVSFQKDLWLEKTWTWDGTHYKKTADAWLANLIKNQAEIMQTLGQTYGKNEATLWFNRWKIFFLAVSELFGYRRGTEWHVSHYLFTPREIV